MINTIIFDLAAVLIDWDPKYLYRKVFKTEEEVMYFLQNICTPDWNEEQDAGRTIAEAEEYLIAKFPEHKANIRAFYGRYPEMLGEEISGTVAILKKLRESQKYKLYALTNWSAETFPVALEKFSFLTWFEGIVVSGTEKDRKPFASFYQTLLNRYQINPTTAIFIDDNPRNVRGAEQVGISSIHFTSPEQLRQALQEKGILV
ncbi:MAG: HAD family hydrolase [Adhaeribacter sp.]